jgi:hypothetical protein
VTTIIDSTEPNNTRCMPSLHIIIMRRAMSHSDMSHSVMSHRGRTAAAPLLRQKQLVHRTLATLDQLRLLLRHGTLPCDAGRDCMTERGHKPKPGVACEGCSLIVS